MSDLTGSNQLYTRTLNLLYYWGWPRVCHLGIFMARCYRRTPPKFTVSFYFISFLKHREKRGQNTPVILRRPRQHQQSDGEILSLVFLSRRDSHPPDAPRILFVMCWSIVVACRVIPSIALKSRPWREYWSLSTGRWSRAGGSRVDLVHCVWKA